MDTNSINNDLFVQGSLGEEQPDIFPENITDSLEYGYRVPIACQIADISYRQLDYWARTGLIVPSVKGAQGSGSHRLYSFKDILILKVIKRLLDTGISLQNIRLAVEVLQSRGVNDLSKTTLLSDGKTVYECTSQEEIIDLLQHGQGVFGITISSTITELTGIIRDFPMENIISLETETQGIDELSKKRIQKNRLTS